MSIVAVHRRAPVPLTVRHIDRMEVRMGIPGQAVRWSAETAAKKRIALQRITVAVHVAAGDGEDRPVVHEAFVACEESFWDAVALCTTFRGPVGVADIAAAFDVALPEFSVEVSSGYRAPGASILEVSVTGTYRGEYCGVPAGGNRVWFEAVAVYGSGEGDAAAELLGERVRFDDRTVLRRTRGAPQPPTGVGSTGRAG
jgi:hypothetical protein